jgi:hypothetical protein
MKYALREKPPALLLALLLVGCSSNATRPGPSGSGGAGGASGGAGGASAIRDAAATGGSGGAEELFDALLDRHDMRPLSTVDAPPPRPSTPDVKAINDRACQVLQMGPFTPVAAAANFTYSAPPIMGSPPAYRVQIPARAAGHVSFTPPAVGEYVIFTSAPIPLALFALDGTILPEKSISTVIPECTQVSGRRAFDLTAVPHVLRLGPATAATVDVAIIPRAP